jgi:ribose transport system substrate-binding protein
VAPTGDSSLVASLGASAAANYNGFTQPVLPSMWAHWKPSHPAPYRVAIDWNPLSNPFEVALLDQMEKTLTASGHVTVTRVLAPSAPTDVAGQLQQVGQLIGEKPDLIIVEPLAPAPSVTVIDAAAKAGIPVVSAWVSTPTAAAVSVGLNDFLQAATAAARVVRAMGGKGTVLEVHGIPGIQSDADAFAGFKAVLALCPHITVAGEVTGDYVNAAAKAAVLQFLATHPAGVGGVLQAGVMGLGVISAFQQLGKPVPPMADLGASQGTIAYAEAHQSSYQEFGTATPDRAIGVTIGEVALKMLAGDGPKVNQIVTQPAYITNANLAQVYQPGWSTTSVADAASPSDPFMTSSYLATFFARNP